jgi:hypothetical protein
VDEYLKHIDREVKVEDEEREKLMKKLGGIGEEMTEMKEEWNSSDTNLFEYLTASNRTVD